MNLLFRRFLLVWLFVLGWITVHLRAQITYREVAQRVGLDHRLRAWTVGCGVSFYDFNQDGLDDLTLGSENGRPPLFFVNRGDRFERIESLVDNQENIKQILWADYDNDGDPDLYLAAFDGINRLYKNRGDLNLEEVTEAAGLPTETHRGYGANWADFNRDGWLDLYYVSRDIPGSPNFENDNRLFLNNADGTFADHSTTSGARDPGRLPFCAAVLDYDNDKWPDIYIANDRLTRNTLLQNEGNASFVDVSDATGAGLRMSAMCVSPADLNQDGFEDIHLTNTREGNRMLLNSGVADGQAVDYQEVATELGITFNGTGWGSNFLDADNDGDLDLYVSGSDDGTAIPSSAFYENIDRQYFEILDNSSFSADTVISYSNAIGDFNNDGLLDILVQNNPPYAFHLWENRSAAVHNWIKIQPEGVLSNRDGIGVKIELTANGMYQSAYTYCGYGFLGQNSAKSHFGVGLATQIDSLILTWPTGHQDRFYNLSPNKIYQIKEGSSTNKVINVDADVLLVERPVTTSIRSELNAPFQISPNPGTNWMRIRLNRPAQAIQLVDLHGRVLLQQPTANELNPVLNTGDLPSGIYWLRVLREDGFAAQKWVKW